MIDCPGSEFHCEGCSFISEKGKCTNYVKKDENVDSDGGCIEWKDLKNGRIEGNHDRTRVQTGYERNKAGFGCRRCEYLIVGAEDCKKVDKDSPGDAPGKITITTCCNIWDKDHKRGNMTTPELVKLIQGNRPAHSILRVKMQNL